MQYWDGGKNTPHHKWYHNIKRLYCYIIGHNRFALGLYDIDSNLHCVDHCRRCEIVITDGAERRHTPSLNLYIRWVMIRVKLLMLYEQHNINLMRVLFPFNRKEK